VQLGKYTFLAINNTNPASTPGYHMNTEAHIIQREGNGSSVFQPVSWRSRKLHVTFASPFSCVAVPFNPTVKMARILQLSSAHLNNSLNATVRCVGVLCYSNECKKFMIRCEILAIKTNQVKLTWNLCSQLDCKFNLRAWRSGFDTASSRMLCRELSRHRDYKHQD
jgi:hypothetical protein